MSLSIGLAAALGVVLAIAPGGRAQSAAIAHDPAVKFTCDFERSWTECGFHEQAKAPGRVSLVTVAGRRGVRLHTRPGDSRVAGSGDAERNDLQLSQAASDCTEGREHWWAHSILFPDDYVDPPMSTENAWNWATVFDFHNSSPGAGQANFQINAMPVTAIASDRPTGLGFQVAHGSQARPTVERFAIGPVTRNVWHDFVYHIKWSSKSDGFITAWVNGAKQMEYRGPTLYPGQGCYLKLANYHTAFGKPSSVIHGRVIRGTSAAAVARTPLQGVSTAGEGK